MASWIDFFSLTATIFVIGGLIYGIVYVINGIQASWASTKESLKTKGLNVSDKGISVKTSKRYDHADYMETTRRGLVNIASASSFGKAKDPASASASSHDLPSIERVSSDSSSIASQEKKKKGIFRSRK